MPGRVRDGVSHYADWDIPAKKVAVAAGVEADFLHPAGKRKVRGEFSAATAADILIAIGVNAGGGIATVSLLAATRYVRARIAHLRRTELAGDDGHVTVRIAKYRRDGDHVEIDGLAVNGPASSIADHLARVLAPVPDNDQSSSFDHEVDGDATVPHGATCASVVAEQAQRDVQRKDREPE